LIAPFFEVHELYINGRRIDCDAPIKIASSLTPLHFPDKSKLKTALLGNFFVDPRNIISADHYFAGDTAFDASDGGLIHILQAELGFQTRFCLNGSDFYWRFPQLLRPLHINIETRDSHQCASIFCSWMWRL